MRFSFGKTALLLGAATLLAPVGAQAQMRDLDSAQSDVRTFSGNVESAAQEFRVSVPANSIMQIDVMTTSGLDPIVTVRDAASGETIAEDDDGGDDLNSRVRIQGGERGRAIVIAVDSFDSMWVEDGETYGGSFDLRLATTAYTPPGPVTYGAREIGTVDGDPQLYTFTAQAGDMIEVALLTDGELDPYLELRDESGEAIAMDDDGGDGLNSLIRHTFDAAGTYTIAAMGFGESTGSYTLRINDRRDAMAAQLPLQVIGFNDEATGELSASWDMGVQADGLMPSFIDYRLSDAAIAAVRRGDGDVTIRMNAGDAGDPDFGGTIDPYVEVGFDTPLGFAVAASDDDGSGALDSELPIDLGLIAGNPDLLEMLRIRVHGYGGTSGAYTLTIGD